MRMSVMNRLFAAFLLLVGALAATAQPITKEQKEEVLSGIEDLILNRAFVPGVDFKRWPEFLERQRDAIDAAEEIPAFTNQVNRALREFGFSHIRLQTPRAASQRGQTSTIGVGMTVRTHDDGLLVTNLAEQGPAARAGIRTGDIVLSIDGKRPESAEELQGDEDTTIQITIRRGEDVMDFSLTRQRFSTVRPETLTWIDDETAVLRVFTFSAGYGRDNIEKLIQEASGKAKYLILDLRSNGGGATTNLNHLLSLFLPEGTVYGTFVNRATAQRYREQTNTEPTDAVAIAEWAPNKVRTRKLEIEPFEGKVAVLTNRGSASASEICAISLRENADAVIVGQRTAGAVLASVYGRLPHGFQLQYPVSDYVSAKGVRLERNPMVPDHEPANPPPDGVDPFVAKAVEVLKGK